VCGASTRGLMALSTTLVATRAAARICVRCMSWSAVVGDVVAINAGSRIDECGVWEPRLEYCLAHGEIKMLLSNQGTLFESESHFSALLRLTRLETVDTPVQHRVMSFLRVVGTTERLLHVSTSRISSSLPKRCNLEKAEPARAASVEIRIRTVERRDRVL